MAMAGNFDRILGSTETAVPAGVMSVDYLTFMCAGVIAATILFTNIYGGLEVRHWPDIKISIYSIISYRKRVIYCRRCSKRA